MLRTFWLSLFNVRFYGQQQNFVGIDNFVRLFTDPSSYDSVVRTAVISTIVIVSTIAISLLLASLLNQNIRGARVYRLLLIWPLALSTAISGIVFLALFNPNFGMVNAVLEPFGIQPEWFRDRTLAQVVLIVTLIWNRVGFNLVFYTAAYQSLPSETLEAALVDGANPWQRFRHVTFPLLTPMTLFLLVTSTVFAFFDAYAVADVFGGGPLGATSILIYEVTENAFRDDRIGLAAAQSLLLFAAVAFITVVQLRQGRKRVTYQ
ncbi:sugar ABC transporter permease [Egibacter rhizosphaerae]|uniref:Sugar ABC transporter permease n=2 Tax=Egibacter rhizosphaerae TaxID=1670831 RepID=A0A411YLU6_9ACTN|nr:sugar ABC transporter permease [Egibacter rhizosphaerae]